jgi:hypothetical protein
MVNTYQYQPGMTQEVYAPDTLIAGEFKIVTDTVTIGSGFTLYRGTVLGLQTSSGNYIPCVKTATDGSQTPVAILADSIDTTAGASTAGIYLTGEFDLNAMTIDVSWTGATIKAALRPSSIFVKSPIDNVIV